MLRWVLISLLAAVGCTAPGAKLVANGAAADASRLLVGDTGPGDAPVDSYVYLPACTLAASLAPDGGEIPGISAGRTYLICGGPQPSGVTSYYFCVSDDGISCSDADEDPLPKPCHIACAADQYAVATGPNLSTGDYPDASVVNSLPCTGPLPSASEVLDRLDEPPSVSCCACE